MTKKQILKKAIEKAIKNGYDVFDDKGFYYQTIFSHDFAKAFFPKDKYIYHLQIMVSQKDPIKYLEKFI